MHLHLSHFIYVHEPRNYLKFEHMIYFIIRYILLLQLWNPSS